MNNTYFFNVDELPQAKKKWIAERKVYIKSLIEDGAKEELNFMEDSLLSEWSFWKQRIDIVSTQFQPNTREQLIEGRIEMTRLNEVLLFMRENNPYSEFKVAR